MVVDVSNGGIPNVMTRRTTWDNWVTVYTAHYCERYAERIMKTSTPTFASGSAGIMYSDTTGVSRIVENIGEGVDE